MSTDSGLNLVSNSFKRAPIKLHLPHDIDWKVRMPRELYELAKQGGKHSDDLKYELALFWRRQVTDGQFSISMRLVEQLYSSRFRKKLRTILESHAECVEKHSNFPGSAKCRVYRFNIRRTKNWPTYNSSAGFSECLSSLERELTCVTIPATWLSKRYEAISEICDRNDWIPCLDLDGRTEWGRPLFAAMKTALIPVASETTTLTQRGVIKAAVRKRGRCYHPITNLRKDIRRKSLLNGEPIAEVDIHACYSCLLVSQLPDCFGKERAIGALQDDWYSQFDDAYSDWLKMQYKKGIAYQDETGQWMIRQDGEPKHDVPASIKVEYQRQCLFWRDWRHLSNPLRTALHQLHPELGRFICRLRRTKTPTELSDTLTRAEGSLVVDYTMAELERAGIVALPIHDALVVPESYADATRDILLGACESHLGFRPKISIKTTSKEQL